MIRRLTLLMAIVAAFGLVAVGCSSGNGTNEVHNDTAMAAGDLFSQPAKTTVSLQMQDVKFEPTQINARVDEVIEIDLKNLGLLDHDFTIEKIDADDAMRMNGMVPEGHQVHIDEYNVHVAMVSKAEAQLRLHVHERGTYEFFCTVPGHREAGMKGSLVVK